MRLTASAFVTKGIKVSYFMGGNPTPLVPYGVNSLHAACGVMITASHVSPPKCWK
jgi:phosphoglucomutase